MMDVYMQGGEPSVFMSAPSVISKLSTYLFDNEARIANLVSDQGAPVITKATALSSVNVIVTDFKRCGWFQTILKPDSVGDGSGSHFAFLLDPEYVSLSVHLRDTEVIRKNGVSGKRQKLSLTGTCVFTLKKPTA